VERVGTSFFNVHMRGRKKMMLRRGRRRRATRRTKSSSRRSLMDKLTLNKNESQVMGALNQKAITWQP
jgi:hypothetical protein